MIVAVAIFELHIEHSQSLKEKRMVVRSLRDRLRNRFEISVAEVALQDLHQRARLAISLVTHDSDFALKLLEQVVTFIEMNAEATLSGWMQELLDFDENVSLGTPHVAWNPEDFENEKDPPIDPGE